MTSRHWLKKRTRKQTSWMAPYCLYSALLLNQSHVFRVVSAPLTWHGECLNTMLSKWRSRIMYLHDNTTFYNSHVRSPLTLHGEYLYTMFSKWRSRMRTILNILEADLSSYMSLLLAISHGYHYIANRPDSSESKQSNGRTFWKRTSVSWLLLKPLQTSWFQLELVLFLLG